VSAAPSKCRFCLFVFLTLFWVYPRQAIAELSDAIVKIYTRHDSPDYFNPWAMLGLRASTGSGCIISKGRILTNAHVVSDQTYIQVRRQGQTKRFAARVLSVSHEADLALLTVDDPLFYKNAQELKLGRLPKLQQEVLVYGFPRGGDTQSITKGVVSRVEHHSYAHSSSFLLAGQIDAAINAGNSGGPVIVDGRIVGVVMQALSAERGENIGYMVPVPTIRHYLTDIKDGQLDGFPSLGIDAQNMENPDIRSYYKMQDRHSGVLVSYVLPGSPLAKKIATGDVILSIDGDSIADNGTIEFRPRERTSYLYALQRHQRNEDIALKILRDGREQTVRAKLTLRLQDFPLVPMEQYDILPSYYIYGGLVFTPLSKMLLKRWGDSWYSKAPRNLIAKLIPNLPEREEEEIVLLLKVLASATTEGYNGYNYWIIEKVDGEDVLNLRDLVKKLERKSDAQYVTISSVAKTQIVLVSNLKPA